MSEQHDTHQLPPKTLVRRRVRIATIVVAIALIVGAAHTIYADITNKHAVEQQTTNGAHQYVQVVRPSIPEQQHTGVTLPATLRGYVESPIYARASGYVQHWYADIGAQVKAGQLLAVLETPEIDQELKQAEAQRAQAQAQAALSLAKTSAARFEQLRQHDAVSQQELDDRVGTLQQGTANLAAAAANVARLQQLESFKRIVAPFDGVVTQRNIDVGDLINAGNAGGSGNTANDRALFALTQSDILRVYISVPQAYSTHVTMGQTVTIKQAEYPKTDFHGKVTHIAGAIDVPTRSLQVEVTLDNRDHRLYPGAYVQVTLPGADVSHLEVPANSLLFRSEGPSLAVVGTDNKVRLHKVVIGQDNGTTLEIESGIQASDQVIVNPSDSVATGDSVTIAPTKKEFGKQNPTSGQNGQTSQNAPDKKA